MSFLFHKCLFVNCNFNFNPLLTGSHFLTINLSNLSTSSSIFSNKIGWGLVSPFLHLIILLFEIPVSFETHSQFMLLFFTISSNLLIVFFIVLAYHILLHLSSVCLSPIHLHHFRISII